MSIVKGICKSMNIRMFLNSKEKVYTSFLLLWVYQFDPNIEKFTTDLNLRVHKEVIDNSNQDSFSIPNTKVNDDSKEIINLSIEESAN